MKRLIQFVMVCFIILFISSFKNNNKDELTITAQLIDTINLSVKTILSNNTNDTLRFESMSCSWFTDYTTDNRNILIKYKDCLNNIPVTIEIPPHQTFERALQLSNNSYSKGFTFQIGFNYIKPEYNWIKFKKGGYRKNQTVIWSNSLVL